MIIVDVECIYVEGYVRSSFNEIVHTLPLPNILREKKMGINIITLRSDCLKTL